MNASGGSLGKIKIPYYVVIKGRGYWRPTSRMKALGFVDIRCGQDGPAAWAVAEQWNARWQRVRRGEAPPPSDVASLTREEAEAVAQYPDGSVGAAFQAYIRTKEWADKALSTRTKIWWPAWYRIKEVWGDYSPDSITFEMMSAWRAGLEAKYGRGVAHKTLKIWRALWVVMKGLKVAHGDDPSQGIRNRAPAPRDQRWREGEVVRLVKGAWRHGYHGLACIMAVAWDSQFSPVDVRTLAARHLARDTDRLVFDRTGEGRRKTGVPAIGTVSRRTERLVEAYLERTFGGAELLPDTLLFRNRSGNGYRDDTLADDFADARRLVFGATETRRLMDMRRSGAIEAVAGEAAPGTLGAKMANSIDTSNALHRTYAPVDLAAVRAADEARLRGRKRIRK